VTSDRHTQYRWGSLWAGAVLAFTGGLLAIVAGSQQGRAGELLGEISFSAVGWGALAAFLKGVGANLFHRSVGHSPLSWLDARLWLAGGGLWILGWALIGLSIRYVAAPVEPPSPARGAPLYQRLARYRDFDWGTLLAYGGGVLASELALILSHTMLVTGVRYGKTLAGEPRMLQVPPTAAFAISLLIGFAVAFASGFLGAARARRLASPEATLGLLYFGLPIPLLLTAISANPDLQLRVGYRLREVSYLAGLLGRPELGYWLVYLGLALMMFFGITTGFVVTGSGKMDVRSGFELFIARRHVAVFRPSLLLSVLAILLFGVIPPLIVYAMVRAAEAAVEQTRIRALGLIDPLKATEAAHQWKEREQSPTAMMTTLSLGGVGVGVMALIIVLSVMSGFEADLQQKIIGTNAQVVVSKYADSFSEYREVMDKVRKVKGVMGETPFIVNEVMISSGANIAGVIIKGIDPATVGNVTDLRKNILPGGSLDALSHPETIVATSPPAETASSQRVPEVPRRQEDKQPPVLQGIILGRELAGSLHATVGDRVDIISPLGGELGPQGPLPKSRPFRVAGIFYSGMYEYDAKFVYILLETAQKFFNMEGASGVEVRVSDVDDARRIAKAISQELDGWPYRTRDWGEMNRNLFSALRLEKLVMGIILTIIVIVAGGLIVATVIMLVLEKRKEIAVLKALGVTDGGIVKIFLTEGLQIGIAGGLLGLLSGLFWCLLIEKVGIKLDPQVYYIPQLPVKIEPLQTIIPVLIAVLVTYLASIYPALKASQVEPVEGLKSE
jgi:lipoprotein-releasing system permease protein